MKKNTIAIITAMYKRHELTDFVFNYYNNLKTKLEPILNLELCVAGSEGKVSQEIAEKNNFNYIEVSNEPLTQKFNAVSLLSKEFNPDAVILIGSDDIISYSTFLYYNNLIYLGIDSFGFLDMYVLDNIISDLYHWKGYTNNREKESIGLGRMYSNKCMNLLNWKPWGNFNNDKTLDFISKKLLNAIKIKTYISFLKNTDSFILDIKTSNNIWGIDVLKKGFGQIIEKTDYRLLTNVFTDDELLKLREIK